MLILPEERDLGAFAQDLLEQRYLIAMTARAMMEQGQLPERVVPEAGPRVFAGDPLVEGARGQPERVGEVVAGVAVGAALGLVGGLHDEVVGELRVGERVGERAGPGEVRVDGGVSVSASEAQEVGEGAFAGHEVRVVGHERAIDGDGGLGSPAVFGQASERIVGTGAHRLALGGGGDVLIEACRRERVSFCHEARGLEARLTRVDAALGACREREQRLVGALAHGGRVRLVPHDLSRVAGTRAPKDAESPEEGDPHRRRAGARTSSRKGSCRGPLLAKTSQERMKSGPPSRSVTRPPASRTSAAPATKSQSLSRGSQ